MTLQTNDVEDSSIHTWWRLQDQILNSMAAVKTWDVQTASSFSPQWLHYPLTPPPPSHARLTEWWPSAHPQAPPPNTPSSPLPFLRPTPPGLGRGAPAEIPHNTTQRDATQQSPRDKIALCFKRGFYVSVALWQAHGPSTCTVWAHSLLPCSQTTTAELS